MKLYKYQQKVFDYIKQFPHFALFMEMGTGKTPIAIELIKLRKVRTLVICPLSILESVWLEELSKWAGVLSSVNGRKAGLKEGDVFVINYEMVRKLHPDFFRGFGMCILDEGHKIKSVKSKISRFLRSISSLFTYRLELTGTPAPNNILEFWPQMNWINPKILNQDVNENPNADKWFYRWRGYNFHSYGYGGYLWEINKDSKEYVMERICRRAIFMAKEDCLDLPEQVTEEYTFDLDKESRRIYDELEENFICNWKDSIVLAQNKLVEIMKFRQITSGFFVDDTGKTVEFSNQKFKILEEVLDNIGNHQVIIWCQFHKEIEKIYSMYPNCSVCLYGKMNEDEKNAAIKSFQNDKVKYLIAHPKSGGLGLNFTNCNYNVFFSQSYSLEEYDQATSRTHRSGQVNKVTYIHINAKDSIDRVIYKALLKKQKISEAMLDMIRFRTQK